VSRVVSLLKDKGFTAVCLFWPHLTLEPHVKNHSMVVLLASRAPLMLRYVLNIPQSPQAHWVNQLKPGPTSSTFPRRLLQTRTHHGNTMTTRVSVSSGKWPSHRLRGVSMLIWSGSKWFSLSNLRVPLLRSSYFQVSCDKNQRLTVSEVKVDSVIHLYSHISFATKSPINSCLCSIRSADRIAADFYDFGETKEKGTKVHPSL
jgi:hypothetical protein